MSENPGLTTDDDTPIADNRREARVATGIPRACWIATGALAVAVGVAGIFLPGLPTTVFILIGGYAFARSSPRLERRLREHPVLGRYLADPSNVAMPLHARVIALLAIWAGIAMALAFGPSHLPAYVALMLALGLIGSAAMLYFTSRKG
jgi:uncharacterized membrane protein YbaN (DUF454 family)